MLQHEQSVRSHDPVNRNKWCNVISYSKYEYNLVSRGSANSKGLTMREDRRNFHENSAETAPNQDAIVTRRMQRDTPTPGSRVRVLTRCDTDIDIDIPAESQSVKARGRPSIKQGTRPHQGSSQLRTQTTVNHESF